MSLRFLWDCFTRDGKELLTFRFSSLGHVCLPPPWLIETFGLALNTQRGAMDGVRYKGCSKPAM